jgi:Flp pilus assembly protein TadD
MNIMLKTLSSWMFNTDSGWDSQAITTYKQAGRLNPDDAEAYYNLGTAYGSLYQYETAIAAYKQAIRIKLNLADMQGNLGVVYR